jgi:3-phenylpropionate/cinnamic acid dioxygenase small subunit
MIYRVVLVAVLVLLLGAFAGGFIRIQQADGKTHIKFGRPKGQLVVTANLGEGEVFIDGVLAGTLREGKYSTSLEAGIHHVLVQNVQYGLAEQQTEILDKGLVTLQFRLKKYNGFAVREDGQRHMSVPGTGSLSIESDKPSAEIMIDGKLVNGAHPPVIIDSLKPGKTLVEIFAAGERLARTLEILPGEVVRYRAVFDKAVAHAEKQRLDALDKEAKRLDEERVAKERERARLAAQQQEDAKWLAQLRADAEAARAMLRQSLEDKSQRFLAQQKALEDRLSSLQTRRRTKTQSLIRNEWNVSNIQVSVAAFDPDRNVDMNYTVSFSRYNGQVRLDQEIPYAELVDVEVRERASTEYALGIPIRWDRVTLTFESRAVLNVIDRLEREKQENKIRFDKEVGRLEQQIASYDEMIAARSVSEAQAVLKRIKGEGDETI